MADPNKLHANHPSIKYAHVRPESKAAAEALLANRGFGHMDVAVALQARDERIKVLEAALKPFVKIADERPDMRLDAFMSVPMILCRNARTALNPAVPASTGAKHDGENG